MDRAYLCLVLLVMGACLPGWASAQQNFGIGNLVFLDTNGDGRYEAGVDEGIEGVQVELYAATADPTAGDPIAQMPTQSGGFYLFTGLKAGDYVVYIPPSQFGVGGPLERKLSVPGVTMDAGSDDDVGEDGYDDTDPQIYGIVSRTITLDEGAQPTAANGENGFAGSVDDAVDADMDLTVDFGFYQPLALGNLVFGDANGDGVAQGSEGIPGVVVQLFHGADLPGTDFPITDVTTDASGRFHFENLMPGSYKLFVPSTQFVEGAVLDGFMSVAGVAPPGTDDDVGEDGLDDLNPSTNGIVSTEVTLAAGAAPTASSGETGQGAAEDDTSDTDSDLTLDLGFSLPASKVGVGNLVFFDANNNHKADPNEGVDNVLIQLFADGDDPSLATPLAQRTTSGGGYYLFGNIDPGSYFLHIPKTEFAVGKPLFSAVSVLGSTAEGDDDVSEEGLDGGAPAEDGVSTATFALNVGTAPTYASGERGLGSESDDYQDTNVDLTHDLGFRISSFHPVGVGNLVFVDADHNGLYTAGEGRDNVLVQLFRQEIGAPTATFVSSMTTHDGGEYGFTNLSPGRYFVHIPASQFALGAPLDQMLSIPGAGADNGNDDSVDENGVDAEDPDVTGISSIFFQLTDNGEPTDLTTESGFKASSDNADDNNTDLTIDLGFAENCTALTITPPTLNEGFTGNFYTVTLGVSGGTSPYFWGAVTSLPAGLSLDSSTGILSGLPTADGVYDLSLYAQDATGCRTTVTRSLTISVPAPTAGVGNVLYVDRNGDGRYSASEGVGGVIVQLFAEGADPSADAALAETQTALGGTYSFTSLARGRYFIHVPNSEFGPSGPLYQKISAPGFSLDNGVDDDVSGSENGIDSEDPASTGISSVIFELIPGSEPVDFPGTETGFDAVADNAIPADSHFDSTIDLAFVAADNVSTGVGNLVFSDTSGNGRYDSGEGLAGVLVQLYAENSDPELDLPLADRTTGAGGRYLFSGLNPGRYFLHIPQSQFQAGKPLVGRISMSGHQGDDGVDDDQAGENGVDAAAPSVSGISSVVFELSINGEPTAATTELGVDSDSDSMHDGNVDLTMDFGFVVSCPAIAITPGTLPDAMVGQPYEQPLTTSAGTAPFTWSIVGGELPDGIVFDESQVKLVGEAITPGTYFFSLRARDAVGCQSQQAFALVVKDPVATLGLGNLVFVDTNANGRYDPGEGREGVTVQLFAAGDDPSVDAAIDTMVTTTGGLYQFTGLLVGDYFVHIPASQFASGEALEGLVSLAGHGSDDGTDDDADENGIDVAAPATTGVSTNIVHLAPGTEPIDGPGGETGTAAAGDNIADANFDATVDLGFVNPGFAFLGVGNLVFTDTNRNGAFDGETEWAPGVSVHLFLAGADPQNDTPLQTQVTTSGSRYYFTGLLPGRYFVHIPAAEFAAEGKLAGQFSLPGAGADDGQDDDVDENGIDSETPSVTGISTIVFTLGYQTEPRDDTTETGYEFAFDGEVNDADIDQTIDLGFASPPITITPVTLVAGNVLEEYSQQLSASGGHAPYTYLVVAGNLPGGLTLSGAGALTGIPTAEGTSNFTVQVRDSYGAKDTQVYSVAINPALRMSVGNLVFFDVNANGRADLGEGVANVTVQLFRSTDTPGSSLPLSSQVTDTAGRYRFDDLTAGTYLLHVPAAMFAPGAKLASMKSMVGVSSGDDDVGEDGQDAVNPAATGVTSQVVTLSIGGAPTDASTETGLYADSDNTQDASVDLTVDFGFVDATPLPATFADWQAAEALGVDGAPNGNPDGDSFNNLIEYALRGDPDSGTQSAPLFNLTENLTGGFNFSFTRRRGSQSDLTYSVELLGDLNQSPAGWDPTSVIPTIVNNGNGTETLTFANLDSDSGVTPGRGFVRLHVALDSNGDGTPDAEGNTQIYGWTRSSLSNRNQTYGITFLAPEIISGKVDSVAFSTVDLSTAASGVVLNTLFQSGYQYYLEVVSGDQEGQRWEINESANPGSGGLITLLPNDINSTSATVPANLAGDTVVIRPHWRIKDLMPPEDFHPANGPNTADNLYFFDKSISSFNTIWLYANNGNPRWVLLGDTNVADVGSTIVSPSDGLFTRPRVAAPTLIQKGMVRTWKFASPLRAGSNFIGNPWPVNQSPTDRGMTVSQGFTGGRGFKTSDRIFAWDGDSQNISSYTNYFLLKSGAIERWVKEGDTSVVDQSSALLFKGGAANFVVSLNGHPTWLLLPPFTP